MKRYTFKKLRELESRINRAYSRCRNTEFFLETVTGMKLLNTWENYMTALRGWHDYPFDDKDNNLTKKEWIEYCEKSNLSPNYNFGDVCA